MKNMENTPPHELPYSTPTDSFDKYEDVIYQPIPLELPPVAGWKDVQLRENGEKLVPFGPFSDNDDIFTSSIYYGEHSNSPYINQEGQLDGSLIVMFARRDLVSSVRYAQQMLPANHYLIVLDSYRTLQVQQALYDHYLSGLKQNHPDWDPVRLSSETQKYVSLPSDVPTRPSPHNTGGSVDLAIYRLPEAVDQEIRGIDNQLDVLRGKAPKNPTPEQEATDQNLREAYLLEMKKVSLIRREAELLNFGTQFDHGGGEAALNYFEKLALERDLTPDEQEARDNRRMLYSVMTEAGLQPYEDEWWHYNSPKSQMGAKVAGRSQAEYGGVTLSPENLAHEQMREAHRAGLVRIQEGILQNYHYAGKVDPLAELLALNEQVLSETGDPRLTHLSRAAIIAPPTEEAA
ncbi:MAG: hypothetical protein JWN38_565 [Candidatus Saccharibacteria bacterium]|nr:hypothetical protein [Candidatus Saccharibacteria bacterium]